MAGNQKQQGQGGQQQSQPKPIKIVVEAEAPQKVGGAWQMLCTAIVSQGDKALGGRDVQFFLNGVDFGAPAQTDENGRVSIMVTYIPVAKVVTATVEAQIVGTAFRARKIVLLPEEPKPASQKPVDLTVLPRRVGNDISFFIQVSDVEGNGVKRVPITFIDGRNRVPGLATDDGGECFHSVVLAPGEEREFIISVGGAEGGALTVSRTFRGR